jgi:peptidoglycan-N-acetylglucosamine deacetylase
VTYSFSWPAGKCCAVSLTYDDALPVHYQLASPLLEAHGFRGTFFLKIVGDPIQNPAEWRNLAERGHELGNHTLFHPCRRNRGRQAWLDKAFDLRYYEPSRLRQEVQAANGFLHLLDGARERTFAHTCFDLFIGTRWNRKRISDLIRGDFVAARSTLSESAVSISPSLDLFNIGACQADGRALVEICEKIKSARERRAWLVYVIHGIGDRTHSSFIEADVHERLLTWLSNQREIWVAPFIEVARWVRGWQMEQ